MVSEPQCLDKSTRMTYEKKDQGAIITLNTHVTCVYVTPMWFFGESNKNDSEASLNWELLSRKIEKIPYTEKAYWTKQETQQLLKGVTYRKEYEGFMACCMIMVDYPKPGMWVWKDLQENGCQL